MTRKIAGLAVALILLTGPIFGAAADVTDAFEGFDEQVEAWMQEWKVPGLGVSIVLDGEVILARGYGYRDLEKEAPATGDTLFAIGSNTKSFTVSLLGMLADDGLFDWDTPVKEYMPDWRLYDPVATDLMTAKDLVTHRSGLPRHDLLWLQTGLSREELFSRLQYLEPNEPFRYKYQYQNLMFMSAGILAERLTGKSWEALIAERLFGPLGMERANLSVDDSKKDDDFSYPYGHEDEGSPEAIPFRNIDAVGPAGSINASAREMAKYVQFHIDYGKVGDEQLLSEETARAMQSPQMPISGPQLTAFFTGTEPGVVGDPSYGLGLMTGSYRGHKHVRHGGGIDGFISSMEWLPHERIGVVVLSNSSSSGTVPGLVVRSVLDRLLGLDPIDWAGQARESQAKAKAAAEEAEKTAAAERHRGTSPSHDLADYAGSFGHPGYGGVEVSVEAGEMKIAAVGFEFPLEHYHYDVFQVKEGLKGRNGDFGGLKVAFLYDKRGTVDRVAIPLESNVSDIVFARLPDAALTQRSRLEKLVGEYELAGQVAKVQLRSETTLVLTVPGQPTYVMVPKQGNTFGLEGLDGFEVEFEVGVADTPASAVTFRQPNGTFVAKRKS
jgi:CubicO group peptidase (beta-lactamase class C family)